MGAAAGGMGEEAGAVWPFLEENPFL
jgi:hypothetical protein